MNDRLKFRYWSKKSKCWFQSLILETDTCIPCYQDGSDLEDDILNEIVVEQCTGLKDKNGKLIFENDVIDIDSSTVNIFDSRAIVVWEDGSFMLQWIPKGAGATSLRKIKNLFKHDVGDIRWWECEVIGNIHQDSHLLGGK